MLLGSHLSPSWKSLVTVSAYAHGFPCLSLFIRGSKLPGTGWDGSSGNWSCRSNSQPMRDRRWWTKIQHVSLPAGLQWGPQSPIVVTHSLKHVLFVFKKNVPLLFVISPLCHAEWASWDHLPNKLFVSKSLVLFLAELTLRWYINLSRNTTQNAHIIRLKLTNFTAQFEFVWFHVTFKDASACTFCTYLRTNLSFLWNRITISLMTQYSFLNQFEQGVWLNSLSY